MLLHGLIDLSLHNVVTETADLLAKL
jgi:hypothetical protein